MRRKGLVFIAILLLLQQVMFMGVMSVHADDDEVKDILDSLFNNQQQDENEADDIIDEAPEEANPIQSLIGDYYADLLRSWNDAGIVASQGFSQVISPAEFIGEELNLLPRSEAEGYSDAVLLSDATTEEIEIEVDIPEEGLYQIKVDYLPQDGKIIPPERGLIINDEFQYFESRRMVFPSAWENEFVPFEKDGLGNDIPSNQVERKQWQSTYLMDASYLFDSPLLFHLEEGANSIKLVHLRESMLLGNITIESPTSLPEYAEYREQQQAGRVEQSMVELQAQFPDFKSDPSVQALPSGDPNVTPYETGAILLNTLGGDSWQDGGQAVTWEVEVEEAGYYQLAFKYQQDFKVNMPVFRTLLINGEIPFQEMQRYAFGYSKKWKNEILGESSEAPYEFYLEEGTNQISLIANPAPIQPVVRTIRDVMAGVNALSLDIRQATGNIADRNRDWSLTEQIPDLTERLEGFAQRLRDEHAYLEQVSGRNPDEARNLMMSAEQLEKLAQEPNSIPFRYTQLSEGSGSVLQLLGDLLIELPKQPLLLDQIYIFDGAELPRAEATFWQKAKANFFGFLRSFSTDFTEISPRTEETVEIWVNRPRQYVMLMQQMANRDFTRETGIRVSLSLMPDEQKLILANAADKAPDIALGIGNQLPFNLAIRGAIKDLTEFNDFDQVQERFSPGALLPFAINDEYYAIPDTQSFYVLFYRQDILEALDLPVPDTWEDVIRMLPELQRFGMNFYLPLSSAGGYKPFALTAPYLYQHGADLYNEEGTRAAIDSEEALKAFDLMTKSFTIYSMPLHVPNFYNHFREGSLPIGVADYSTYIQLTAAAPEIAGWWKIAPHPGVEDENGEVIRWAPGTGAAGVIFDQSEKQEEAWEFMKWWTSTETQVEFGNMMETIYGLEYRWNSSNVEAFEQLPWPQDDLDVILEQWTWLRDIPRIPGDYMVERELSNAWNRAVFDGDNARRALEDAALTANREIWKKLHEFGFMENGTMIQELRVPQIKNLLEER
ncbi:extracellular solute-binding protein [Bacillus horti]|uniref:ABC-type glycerol-3-phosphate transport system substrate-binding protein n=1 Tax=Caldalkalibacillus horti TaxID=77523 RepID=A0ABT9W583_9BACI|nr:extracellular solute-binding protein [Bacillus horti]MDQ0168404.1 ABC-type glycerol-3-phosphate transport system substrate-binding protein [Bacillus horti]